MTSVGVVVVMVMGVAMGVALRVAVVGMVVHSR
jgi:hypothetical protein